MLYMLLVPKQIKLVLTAILLMTQMTDGGGSALLQDCFQHVLVLQIGMLTPEPMPALLLLGRARKLAQATNVEEQAAQDASMAIPPKDLLLKDSMCATRAVLLPWGALKDTTPLG